MSKNAFFHVFCKIQHIFCPIYAIFSYFRVTFEVSWQAARELSALPHEAQQHARRVDLPICHRPILKDLPPQNIIENKEQNIQRY